MSKVYVGNAEGKGRGVFAAEKIFTGETIELSHVIEFPKEEWEHISKSVLGFYCYFWGEEEIEDGVMVLGNGSLYNHSFKPNAQYIRRYKDNLMEYVALQDIEAGEEIKINYNGRPDNYDEVWFDVIE